jgi:hypothetical protein
MANYPYYPVQWKARIGNSSWQRNSEATERQKIEGNYFLSRYDELSLWRQ